MELNLHSHGGFRGLQNYTTLKQGKGRQFWLICFRGLQNYTTLKRSISEYASDLCFRGLQNYTTLKPQIKFEAQE